MSRPLNDLTYEYIKNTFAKEDNILEHARNEGDQRYPGMQISAAEGKILQFLVKLSKATNILEIGTFVGYSTIWMARVLPEGGKIVTMEKNEEHADIAEESFKEAGLDNTIKLIRGDAENSLKTLKELFDNNLIEPFDMVFIDAIKLKYIDFMITSEPMLRKGGLMIGDNSLLFGAMTGKARLEVSKSAHQSMSDFNKRIADNKYYDNGIMLPTIEGMTIGIKKH